jgi:hypothetical protein
MQMRTMTMTTLIWVSVVRRLHDVKLDRHQSAPLPLPLPRLPTLSAPELWIRYVTFIIISDRVTYDSVQDACGQCAARYQLCEPFEQRVTALACNFCTIQKIRCYPKAKWAQEEEEAQETQKIEDQKKPNKGKGKKRNVVVGVCRPAPLSCPCQLTYDAESVDNLSSAIDSLKSEVSELRSDFNTKLAEASQEIVKLQSEFGMRIGEASQEIVELRKYSLQQDQMLRGLCLQAGVSVSSLNLRIPPPSTRLQIPPAPTHDEQAASTPSASSVISNVSSTSSHLHLGSLMIDSPTPGTASLPLAGLSGSGSGSGSGVQRAQIRGIIVYTSTIQCAKRTGTHFSSNGRDCQDHFGAKRSAI